MSRRSMIAAGLLGLVAGCSAGAGQFDARDGEVQMATQALGEPAAGHRLFAQETFGGNGRTCETCHSVATGTISPETVQARLATDPGDPLFVHDGLDDDGVGTTRIAAEATIRITLQLPDYVSVAGDPDQRTIDVFRGVPTTINTPGLDPALMYDLREPDLVSQALGAIHAHAQNTREPSQQELQRIADFQQEQRRFYTNPTLKRFAEGGPPPALPPGHTASEKRGREMFVDAPIDPSSKKGVCALCHSGPMLNETNQFGAQIFPVPEGTRFHPVFAGDPTRGRNFLDHPVHELLLDNGLGEILPISTTDPGVLFNPSLLPPPDVIPREIFNGIFKTPQLWGVAETAPYFHDNSAPDLMAVMDQYAFFFEVDPFLGPLGITFSQQDKDDAVAYMKRLR